MNDDDRLLLRGEIAELTTALQEHNKMMQEALRRQRRTRLELAIMEAFPMLRRPRGGTA